MDVLLDSGVFYTGSFIGRVAKKSSQPLSLCFQCQKCSSGCPVSDYTDFTASQVVRLLQYGQKDVLLESRAIWLCSGCETCGARCPNGISVGRVMDALKEMAVTGRREGKLKNVMLFHREFLDSVTANGRVHEAAMLIRYKLKSGQLFSDIKLGLSMFRKGKLKLMPTRVRDKSQVRRIFEISEKPAGEAGAPGGMPASGGGRQSLESALARRSPVRSGKEV